MTVSILRTADAWFVQTPTGAAQITTTATTTRQLLADRSAIEAAHSSDTVPLDSLHLVSPITVPCRVVAQLANYASHAADAGRNPKTDLARTQRLAAKLRHFEQSLEPRIHRRAQRIESETRDHAVLPDQ